MKRKRGRKPLTLAQRLDRYNRRAGRSGSHGDQLDRLNFRQHRGWLVRSERKRRQQQEDKE